MCPDCEDVYLEFLNKPVKCAFYDHPEPLLEYLDEEQTLVFEENHEGFGMPVSSRGLMHNKFCIDGDMVITGSANPTKRGLNTNYNNIIIIESETIANNYRTEWEELRNRGSRKTRHTKVNLSGIMIENYFCPEDDCEEEVLEELGKARQSIHFYLFSFTSDPIGELLIAKSKQIEVRGAMESFGLNRYSEYEKLGEAGIGVTLERTGAMLHHKVFIIDNRTIILGSYNPTASGNTRNDENILIIHDRNISQTFKRGVPFLQ